MLYIYVVIVICAIKVEGGKEGDICRKNGVSGVCKDIKKCPTVVQDSKNKTMPQMVCSFNSKNPIVCCFDRNSNYEVPLRTTTKRTTPYYDLNDKYNSYGGKDVCSPLPDTLTAKKNGQKAWDKCIEYQQLVFPCEKAPSRSDGMVRADKCHHYPFAPVATISAVSRYELLHAALLGYGDDLRKLQWLCGGALVSDRFILTAAHCTYSKKRGPVTYAALHALKRTDINPHYQYRIRNIVKHPGFKCPKTYHDIALLELETSVQLDSFTVPACLDTGGSKRDLALSTTLDMNDKLGTHKKELQKMHLSKFSTGECSKAYPEHRKGGFNATTQLCYGDRTQSKEICEDDGGSPLLVENRWISCMYSIIGITSYGKGCLSHNPGVYTRVEYYIPWIEGVVWPN